MPTYNPDFRTVAEVVKPADAQFGWTDGKTSETAARLLEQQMREKLENDMPVACKGFSTFTPIPTIWDQWLSFQKSKGRAEGGWDWSLMDEFVLQRPLLWLPQIIGSCVISNTFRGWTIRLMSQISLLGEPFEFLGREEFSPKNFAFYAPWSYGAARKRANMRGGDGLYCEPMQESLLKDGVISCSTPKLLEICQRLGVAKERDFPEPQDARVYRAFGDWQYLDELRPYADYTLEECPSVNTTEQLWVRMQECKPAFVCSMIAIRKIGDHRDGFPLHGRDPNDQWAHNMCFHGAFITSDNRRIFRLSNESWGPQHIYNVYYEEVDTWFRRHNLTVAAIGQIRGPKSVPPMA